jgi:outer membrane protein assembly factor BamB
MNRAGSRRLEILLVVTVAFPMLLVLPAQSSARQLAGSIPPFEWPKFHLDVASTGFNPRETVLSPATVGGLTVKWTFGADGGLGSSPVVVGGVAYTASGGGQVYAVNADTGTLIWTQKRGTAPSDITVAQGMAIFGTVSDHRLYALDATTGALRWFLQAIGAPRAPLVIGDSLYVATNAGELFALSVADGTVQWESFFPGGVDNGIAAAGRYLYVGDAAGCSVRAFDRRDGSLKWTTCVGDQIPGTPTVAGGKVFVGARDGNVYALDARTGTILWTGDTGEENFSSAAAAYGLIYIGSTDGKVYAFPQDCSDPCLPAWTYQTFLDIVGASPIVANGVVYTGAKDDRVYALDAMTGAKLWSYHAKDYFGDAPALLDGVLYIGSFDNHLYAFSLPDR